MNRTKHWYPYLPTPRRWRPAPDRGTSMVLILLSALALLGISTSVVLAQSFDLRRTQLISQNSLLLSGNPSETGDLFGLEVAAGDFDCDGFDDLAIAAPHETIPIIPGAPSQGTILAAGVVHVLYGNANGISTFFGAQEIEERDVGGISEATDFFGDALAAGDFNGDTCDDLVIGIPGEDFDGAFSAGAFVVVYGSLSGLDTDDNQLFTQNQSSVLGFAETGDRFGAAFAVGNFDGQGPVDLAVAAPGEGIGIGDTDEGAVWLFEGSADGLLSGVDRPNWTDFFSQGTAAVLDDDEPGDRFGSALSACDIDGDGRDELMVGVPREDDELSSSVTLDSTGAVHTFFGSSAGIDLSDSRNTLRFGASVGDQYGSALSSGQMESAFACAIAVGIPFRDIFAPGLILNAGSVEIWQSNPATPFDLFLPLHQGALATNAEPEAADVFGSTLAMGDFRGDGWMDLAIGVWAEHLDQADDGLVQVVRGEGSPLNFARSDSIAQGPLFTPSDVTTDSSRFGFALAVGDFDGDGRDDLAVSAPFAEFDGFNTATSAGLVRVLYGIEPSIFEDGFESGDLSRWQ
ncbi:MAG: FG-GAP-like repeat-containing protein [Thermoanaerobaculia bacterium]|nr:FG-GAP-like repeat-containing protein [Thermoanaerobaculia bacterium]